MYFKIRLKNSIISVRLMIFVLISIGLGLCCIYFANKKLEEQSFTIAVIDRDKTEASETLIDLFSEINGIDLIRFPEDEKEQDLISTGKYYLVYIIKKGYMKNLKAGKIKNLIDVKSFSSNTSAKWLNDKLSAIILREYVFYDIFLRMNVYEKISLEEYKSAAKRTQKENEILSLHVVDVFSDPKIEKTEIFRINKYAVFISLSMLGLYLGLKSGERSCRMKHTDLKYRLNLSGVSSLHFLISEFLISFILYLIPMLLLMSLVPGIGIPVYLVSVVNMMIGYLAFTCLEKNVETPVVYTVNAWIIYTVILIFSIIFMYFRL